MAQTKVKYPGLIDFENVDVHYLVVAGGGGGGYAYGGGGGAGGLKSNYGGSALSISIGTNYTVTVDAGGAAATQSGQKFQNQVSKT